jgi:hypothetical protein
MILPARWLRFAYLVAQHPLHLHRALVRRGLALGWVDDFARVWDALRPPSVPVTDYAAFQALQYQYASAFRDRYPGGDHWDDVGAQRAHLFRLLHRREWHPLRWWSAAWALRKCRTILEYGAGAAPFTHGMLTAWPGRLPTCTVADQPGLLLDYCRLHFADEDRVLVEEAELALAFPYDGIVCTEVFEHLPDPTVTACRMMAQARVIVFDYVDTDQQDRETLFGLFRAHGTLTGPTWQGLYVWTRR